MDARLVPASSAILRVVSLSMPYFSMQVTTASRISCLVVVFSAMDLPRVDPTHLRRDAPQSPCGLRIERVLARGFWPTVLPIHFGGILNARLGCQIDDSLCRFLRRDPAPSTHIPDPASEERVAFQPDPSVDQAGVGSEGMD